MDEPYPTYPLDSLEVVFEPPWRLTGSHPVDVLPHQAGRGDEPENAHDERRNEDVRTVKNRKPDNRANEHKPTHAHPERRRLHKPPLQKKQKEDYAIYYILSTD